ncbi:hypothetical protein BDR26DRAFT_859487 [Obelidium mucronatum]|nr:hypothetical protein BDR26DRAFT_859487 [Obelidium mucronatum]
MERLTELHALTEQQYLDAYLALKFAQKKLACFQEFSVDSLENLTQISFKIPSCINSQYMIQTRLKPLCTESAEQSVKTLILQTDYAAKFVGLLLSQQSRHQFLAIAFETEVAMLKRDWYKIPQSACDKLPNRLIDGRDELMKEIMRDLEMDETTKEHAVSSIVFSSIDTVIAKAKSLVQEVRVSEKKCSLAESARRAIVKDV